ncbi:hypothetical protein TNIN_244881 [Trichonephila inaurata madagascariensis]|uniref:Uncharacterized protein n=1 Tax=Trichonephila inaurata madagascariensis TaxID=2747483 RepID=A0A8X6Y4X6_9ARAC|nr:hypothetical protein TNIN_244881 [Trichonephila inaurata madagascariensis]
MTLKLARRVGRRAGISFIWKEISSCKRNAVKAASSIYARELEADFIRITWCSPLPGNEDVLPLETVAKRPLTRARAPSAEHSPGGLGVPEPRSSTNSPGSGSSTLTGNKLGEEGELLSGASDGVGGSRVIF